MFICIGFLFYKLAKNKSTKVQESGDLNRDY